MTASTSFEQFTARFRDFISRHLPHSSVADGEFDDLARSLFHLQFETIPVLRRLAEDRNLTPGTVNHWSQIPALPTIAFKDFKITSLAPEQQTTVFHSSGTTQHRPGRHFHSSDSLAVYEASLLPWFQQNFLSDWNQLCENDVVQALDKPGFIFLTPSPALAPHSSLVHMFETVRNHLGARDSFFAGRTDETGSWILDLEQVLFGIRKSMCANRPVAILGTAFSFVHLLDHFAANNMRYRLAEGSRVLETGGYKGRSQELPKEQLHSLITKHLGIPASHIVCEYGMSELSSQAYDLTIGNPVAATRVFHFPPWARAQIVSPETGAEVGDGETGLLRIFDLANVRSVMAVQTEDLAIKRGTGFELVGRAALAEARGCSLMPA